MNKKLFVLFFAMFLLVGTFGFVSAEKWWNFNNHTVNISDDLYVGGSIYGDGSGLTNLNISALNISTQWLEDGNDIYYQGGKVAIGTDFNISYVNAPFIIDTTESGSGNAIYINDPAPVRWTGGAYIGLYGGFMSMYSGGYDMTFRGYNGTSVVDSLFMDVSENRIGIGTTTPGSKLDVVSEINPEVRISPGADVVVDPTLYLTDTSANNGFKLIYDNSNGVTYFDSKYNHDNGDMRFRTKVDGSPINAFTIDGTGNVGVGLIDPLYTLDVSSSDANSLRVVDNLGTTYLNGGGVSFTRNTAYVTGQGKLIVRSGGDPTMILDSNDNVGIGVDNPGYKLDVNGTINAHDFLVNGSSIFSSVSGSGVWNRSGTNVFPANLGDSVGIGTNTPSYDLDVLGSIRAQSNLYVGNGGGYFYSDSGSRIRTNQDFYLNNVNTFIYGDNTYLGSTSGDNVRVRDNELFGDDWVINYNEAGNWGIGTNTPSYDLDVLGTINAENILINGSAISVGDGDYLPLSGGTMSGGINMGTYNLIGFSNLVSNSNRVLPHLVLDSTSSGDDWSSQGAYVGIGESASSLGSAAMYMTYTGNGYGYIGSGAVASGVPGASYFRFDYDSNNIYSPDNLYVAAINTGNGNKFLGDSSITDGDVNSIPTNDQVYDFVTSQLVGGSSDVWNVSSNDIYPSDLTKPVGIGTSVVDSGANFHIKGFSGSNSASIVLEPDLGHKWTLFASGAGYSSNPNGINFYDHTNSEFAFVIDDKGYVGINGVSDPQQAFHVSGNVAANQYCDGPGTTCYSLADLYGGGGGGGDADTLDSIDSTGFSRAFGTQVFSSSGTTSDFITELSSKGFFDYSSATAKGSWNYAGNSDISDTGFGAFELAGTAIQTWRDGSTRTVLAIRPTTGEGGGQVLIYNDQGSSYSPGWRQIWTSSTDGSGSGLDADMLDGLNSLSYLRSDANDFISGSLLWNGDQDYDGLYWGSQYKDVSPHEGAWGYIRQSSSPGQLEFGSDSYFSFYETDARSLAFQINANNGNTVTGGDLTVQGGDIYGNGNVVIHIG